MPSRTRWTVGGEQSGWRLDKFLADASRLRSRSAASTALDRGRVFVDGRELAPADASRRVQVGECVEYWEDRPGSARRHAGTTTFKSLRIVYEDEALVVVDKPPGLLTVPLGHRPDEASVQSLLEERFTFARHTRPLVVHRIDRDTSGLVVFAKSTRALSHLKTQFERRSVRRLYVAVVHGVPRPASGVWRDTLAWDADTRVQRVAGSDAAHARDAVCRYAIRQRFAHAAVLEIALETGKRNQIRVQAARRGHMLVGERQYVSTPPPTRRIDFPRQALHAWRLELVHPLAGTPLTITADFPSDIRQLMDELGATK